jgi:predicted sulfurtransferase
MTTLNRDLNVKGVYHMRGGIERYVKTFPKGGFWNGKNYLFDRRMEQVPGTKEQEVVEQEVDSKCCVCRRKWTAYRGKFKCSQSLCGVPVIVCPDCDMFGLEHAEKLNCELCKQ